MMQLSPVYLDTVLKTFEESVREEERRKSKSRLPPGQAWQLLGNEARALLKQKIPLHERVTRLRTIAQREGLLVRDSEIKAIFSTARKNLRGEQDGFDQGQWLDIPEESWIWEPILSRGGINLVTALQKVGKTNLVLQLIRLWSAGAEAFLGHQLQGECPPVIVVGPDMSLRSWRKPLIAAGLMQRNAYGQFAPVHPIVKLFTADNPLHLDEPGLDRLVVLCEQHHGALILIDSFAAATAPLALDENKAEAAEPLYALREAVSPYDATVVLIHHSSKSRSGERPSNAARGSNAITAAVDQLINLKWHSDQEGDHRVELHTEGRGGRPIQLLIEQVSQCEWLSRGDLETIRKEKARREAQEKLTDRQSAALDEVTDAWEDSNLELSAKDLKERLAVHYSGIDGAKSARENLRQLERKQLLTSRRTTIPGRGEVHLFRPFGTDFLEATLSLQDPPPDPPQPPQGLNHEQLHQPFPSSTGSVPTEASEGPEGQEGIKGIPGLALVKLARSAPAAGSGADVFTDDDDPHWGPRPGQSAQ